MADYRKFTAGWRLGFPSPIDTARRFRYHSFSLSLEAIFGTSSILNDISGED
jgi:hypothetical protein